MADKFIGKWAFPADDSLLEQSARRVGNPDFDVIAHDIIDKVHFEPEDVVLDVCCGNAALTKRIAPHCKKIYGVDFSETLLKTAEQTMMEEQVMNMELHRADALQIDEMFAPDSFDKSYCYFSFQYFNLHNRMQLLEKLSRVTKRKGWIFIGDIPDRTRMWNFYESKGKFYREKLSHLLKFKEGECDLGWWVDPKEIILWCERNKLSASIMSQENLPHAHYRFDVLIRNSKA